MLEKCDGVSGWYGSRQLEVLLGPWDFREHLHGFL
jgi:hypothetical protein